MSRYHWIYLGLILLVLFLMCSDLLFGDLIIWKDGSIINFSSQSKISSVVVPEPFFSDMYINIVENRSISSLLLHEALPPHIRSDIISKIHNVSLVISHCDHPLSWLTNVTNGYENVIGKVWILTKCGKEVIDAPQNAEIITLPNVGRCDHTFAYWMNNSYIYNDEMNPIGSPYDIIVFLKDTDYMFDTQNANGEEFGDLISLAVANGLGCKMSGINLHAYDTLRWMECGNGSDSVYVRNDGGDLGEEVPFHNNKFPNLGVWADHVHLHPSAMTQNIVPVCCGGVWAVTSHQIAKHPKSVWMAIAKSLSRGDNIIEGHYAERLWASLLSKPLSNESANAVWAMNPVVNWEPCFFRGLLTLP